MIRGKIVSCAGILWQKEKEKQLRFGLFQFSWVEVKHPLKNTRDLKEQGREEGKKVTKYQ